jgi:hypothetical protein
LVISEVGPARAVRSTSTRRALSVHAAGTRLFDSSYTLRDYTRGMRR